MIIGTTPTHSFNNSLKAADIKTIEIAYAQDKEVVLTKSTPDCIIKDNLIQVTLTQEDTFKFNDAKIVEIQVRVLKTDNKVVSIVPKQVSLVECFSDEVLKWISI